MDIGNNRILSDGDFTAYPVDLNSLSILASEINVVPLMAVDGMGVSVLAHPVAFVAA